ncbi:MAG: hypothetical protein JO255_04545 [Alphaproteobacteria bacterium]|nr:hypothetical protein [Alphaproteobacteria bacterium]
MPTRHPEKPAEKPDFPFPPPDFDPLSASPAELAKYGLPRKPNADRQPELLKAWLRLFERPLTFRHPGLTTVMELIQKPEALPISVGSTRIENSPNWCGASIVPHGGRQFVLMFGEWTVPKPSLPPPPEQGPAGQRNDYHCVMWIGLDGSRRYLDSSLPQIGTEQVLTVDAAGQQSYSYFPWFQWWARHQVAVARTTLTDIQIDAGVQVMAMISVIDPHHVVAVFRTFAPLNQITILVERSPEVWLTSARNSKIRPAIAGATAEWILERPMTLDYELELFADYNPVQFRHCVAGVAAAPGPATAEETLTGPRLYRLFEVPKTLPPQMRLLSMPRRLTTTSIRVHYGGFPG